MPYSNKLYTVRLTKLQLTETIKGLKEVMTPENRVSLQEVVEKLGAAFVACGDERSEIIVSPHRSLPKDDPTPNTRVSGTSPGISPWRKSYKLG